MNNKISRKKFLISGATGLAAIGLLSSATREANRKPASARVLGRTGIMVPPLCFGATRISEDALLKYAIDQGFTFLDTGRSYANGNNERMVGRVINGIRKDIIIQSKIRLDMKEVPSGINTRKGAGEIKTVLSKRLEESLMALNTDYIDILLYHDASEENLLFHDSVKEFFETKKAEKVIRAFGFSTHNDCLHLPERNNTESFYEVIMLPFNYKGSYIHSLNKTYSEWDQSRLIALLEKAHEKNIGFVAMKTCSAGAYSQNENQTATYAKAVEWVLKHEYVSSAAVAMANFDEISEHLPALTT